MEPIIDVKNISKVFPARRGGRVLIGRGGLQDWLRRRKTQSFAALKDVSFTVAPGESVGIIGRNGSGKSTLLKILSGVTSPTTGEVNVYGRVASLLELGAGFHPMLTGRENIYLNAGMLGVRHRDTRAVFDSIVEFSGIADFIDNPVDTYSSGMYVRLGFAVAVHMNPDIFIVDEVLAVGDEAFQRRCRQRINELRRDGKTIVFVSHDLGIVNALCDRVILLADGQMIQRATPQATIEFYLRQVGASQGTHILRGDGLETIVSNGRLSLFKDEQELTASSACNVSLNSLDYWHHSTDAVWHVYESSERHCKARGEMPRLPIVMEWEVKIENGVVTWKVALDCKRDAVLGKIDINIMLPAGYDRWAHGPLEGEFPELTPSDTNWAAVVISEMPNRHAAAFSEEGDLTPLAVDMVPDKAYMRMEWFNTDYALGCRALKIGAHVPSTDKPFKAGRHELATISIDTTQSAEKIRAASRARLEVEHGPLRARFQMGSVELFFHGEPVTQFLHVYSSMLIGHLWNDTQQYQWGWPENEAGQLKITGESRRFPCRQHWTLRIEDQRLYIKIELEALEPLEVQEYQVSVVLPDDYNSWATDFESGEFPPYEEDVDTWRHANENYAPGREIRTSGPGLTGLRLVSTREDLGFRMTPINTGIHQRCRVLQALRTPDHGRIHFDAGMHPYFEGYVELGGD